MTAQATLDARTAPSLYTSVGARLDALAPSLRLERRRETMRKAYALLCRSSLQIPVGSRPLHGSRLNEDGTPFQLGLALAGSTPRLQLISDVGPLSERNAARTAAARRRLPRIAHTLGASMWVSQLVGVLDELASSSDPDLLGGDAGPVWFGVSFAAGRPASLKLYLNARWGNEDERWARLTSFAKGAGVRREWHEARACAAELEPLGFSLTVSAGSSPKHRFYLGGYGRRFGYYEGLARASGGSMLEKLVRRYGRTLLADDYDHPTRSVVWSFGAEDGSLVDYKLELCGHCAFDDDVQARERSLTWLRSIGTSAAPYTRVVDVLSGMSPPVTRARLHAYLGVGTNRGRPYSTFYFNPAATIT